VSLDEIIMRITNQFRRRQRSRSGWRPSDSANVCAGAQAAPALFQSDLPANIKLQIYDQSNNLVLGLPGDSRLPGFLTVGNIRAHKDNATKKK
jgi:hypothetical protein